MPSAVLGRGGGAVNRWGRPEAVPWLLREAPAAGHLSSPSEVRPGAAFNTSCFPRGAQGTAPEYWGAAALACPPSSASGLPLRWWGGRAGSRRGKCSWPCGPRTGRSLRQCCGRVSRERRRKAGPRCGLLGPQRSGPSTRPRVMWPRPPGSSAAYARWSRPGRRDRSRRWCW